MSMHLQVRVTNLEEEVRLLRAKLEEVAGRAMVLPELEDLKKLEGKGPALCPKCGEKPGYFFHVKNCKGSK